MGHGTRQSRRYYTEKAYDKQKLQERIKRRVTYTVHVVCNAMRCIPYSARYSYRHASIQSDAMCNMVSDGPVFISTVITSYYT
mmetsp:Transcript_15737/g.34050  ORF Transcript_15737/g.34050 Transcript_15737/m.34050 type:complete len:83 (+) Transcript_15737:1403-1651(+)